LADRKSAKSCVVYLTKKKQKFCKVTRSRFCADLAQNLSGPAPNNILGVPQISSKPFPSGGVIAERVNIVETRHKVFPILGEASSPSNDKIFRLPVSHFPNQFPLSKAVTG